MPIRAKQRDWRSAAQADGSFGSGCGERKGLAGLGEVASVEDDALARGALDPEEHLRRSEQPCRGYQDVSGFDEAQRGFRVFVALNAEDVYGHIRDIVQHDRGAEIGL